jgi:hypothetical protein
VLSISIEPSRVIMASPCRNPVTFEQTAMLLTGLVMTNSVLRTTDGSTRWTRLLLCLAWLSAIGPAWAVTDPAAPKLGTVGAGNVYRVGSAVHTEAPVPGDFIAAAGHVSVDQAVAKDVSAAGGEVEVLAAVGDDLRAAGGQVTLAAPVAGDALLLGGRITLTRDARIAGRAWLAGGDVNIDGTLEQGAKVHASRVRIDGIVGGDLRVVARSLTLGPQADIRGQLRYSSAEAASIDPKAKIASAVREVEPAAEADHERPVERATGSRPLRTALWWLGLLAAGALWQLLFPTTSAAMVERLNAAPGRSLGLGLLVLAAAPPLAVVLVFTLLGIPLALLLLASWALVALLGFVTAAAFVGDRVGQIALGGRAASPAARLGTLALALLLLALVGLLPWFGALVQLVALLIGAGALLLWLLDHARGKSAGPAGARAG